MDKNTEIKIEIEIIDTMRKLPENDRYYLKGVADALLSKHQLDAKGA